MLANFVLENANAPGTGTVTLAGAPTGRRTFLQAFSAGASMYYAIDDGTQAEEGYGVLTAGPPATLTRVPLWTSSGGVAPLNFTGTCRVYCTLPAERALWADGAGVYQAQTRRLANLGAASLVSDAPRLDQVGWAQIGASVTLGSGSGGAIFSLPAMYNKFRLEYQDMMPASAAAIYFRVSVDGGATYDANAAEYVGVFTNGLNGAIASGATSNTYAAVTTATLGAAIGYIEVQSDGNHEYMGQSVAPASTGPFGLLTVGGVIACSGVVTNLLMGAVGYNMNGGKLRLLGAKF